MQYSIAASSEQYREFVFDPAGHLLFYFSWTEDTQNCGGYHHDVRDERRYYFTEVHKMVEKIAGI